MTAIQTLTGPISPDDLGIVSMHEYLLKGLPGWHLAPEVKYNRAEAFDAISTALAKFKDAGGQTIVDMSGITLGRNVPFYKRLSEVSGVNIVSATGLDNQTVGIPGHFRTTALFYRGNGPLEWKRDIPGHFAPQYIGSKEYMMFLLFNELTEGMVAPGMIRTPILAGLVKAGCSWDEISHVEELSIRGAAMASVKSGVSLVIDGLNLIDQSLDLLFQERLPAERIIVAGCDDGRATDIKRDQDLAAKGVTVAYDHVGWEGDGVSDDQRVDMIKTMMDAGYGGQLAISSNAIACPLGVEPSKHGFDHVLENFVPKLKSAGLDEAAINNLLVENPKRILTPGQGEGA
jgi:predicted metal-dependent phosphotriesterase family hydrolase